MANKLMDLLGWVILIAIVVAVIFFIAEPMIWSEEYPAWVVYARVFLLLFTVSTFAQLRLFNAVVRNSLFLIKLRDAVYKLTEKFPMLDKGLKAVNIVLTKNTTSSESLKKTLDTSVEATEKLSESLNNFKENYNKLRKEETNA